MKLYYTKYIVLSLLIVFLTFLSSSAKEPDIISEEALLKLDSRMLFSSFINNSPGDGMTAEVNPPCFRWFYVPDPLKMQDLINPIKFRFIISGNKNFENPLVDIETDINFYNELAPFPDGKIYYWKVGYILYGENKPSVWTKTFSVNIPEGTSKWDRSVLSNPEFNNKHPRLLYKQEQFEELKKIVLAQPLFNEYMVPAADKMITHKWWNNWPKTDLDNPEYTYGFYWRLTQELIKTAFVYRITGDEKYKNILDIWKTIATYPKGGASSPEGMGFGADSEDNTSITEYMACVYDWFYNEFSPGERTIFEKSLEWRLEAWMYDFTWGGSIFTNGKDNPKLSKSSLAIAGKEHAWEGALATYPAAIVLYEKSETARKYFHFMSNYLISIGELQGQNGGYDNGAAYGQSHMKWLVYQLMYLNSVLPELEMGKNPLYRQYAEFFMSLVPIGMEYSHLGRLSQHGAGLNHRHEVFNLLAYLTKDGETLYNWTNLGEKKNFRWRSWIHASAPLQLTGIDQNTLQLSPSNKTKFIFPATGYIMAHKYSPSEAKAFNEGVGVIFRSRPSNSDQYNDENTFQMYAYGQQLNYGGHSGDENPYGFQTIAHNTIMVDGIGQTITRETHETGFRAAILAYKEGDNYTYWMGDAAKAYPKEDVFINDAKVDRNSIGLLDPETQGSFPKNAWSLKTQIDFDSSLWGEKGAPQLELFRRHMLFMRDKYLVVYDDLKTKKERPSKFSWRYRVLPESNAKYNSAEGKLTYKVGDVKVIIQHIASPENLDFVDLKDLDQYKNPITGEDYMMSNPWVSLDMHNKRYREKAAQHNFWFTTKTAESVNHFLTVVYPVKPGTEDPVITRLDNNTVKVEKDGEVDIISFDKNTKFPAAYIIDLETFRKSITFGDNN